MASIERRLAVLEAKVPPANGHNGNGHEPEEQTTLEDVYKLLRNGDLRFDAPGHASVGSFIGKSTEYYTWLAGLAAEINRVALLSLPGAVWAPINMAQVHAAMAALDAGEFMVSMSSNYGPAKARYCGISSRWGATREISALADIAGDALNVFIDQLPPDACKEDFQSLEGLRWMLDWCKERQNDNE